jgi:hypothetical protein
MIPRLDLLNTTEDIDIRLDRETNQNAHAWIHTLLADDASFALMRRLVRTRKSNRRARAYAEITEEQS